MSFTAQAVADEARRLVADINARRWGDVAILKTINHANLELTKLHPPISTTALTHSTTTGVVQTLASAFLEIRACRISATHEPIVPVTRRVLGIESPAWFSYANQAAPYHYIFEPDTSETDLYLWPGSTGTVNIDIEGTRAFDETDIPLMVSSVVAEDRYLMNYAYYTAYLLLVEDSSQTVNLEKAESFKAKALESLAMPK